MSYIHGYDPDTLREITDSRECQERLDEIGSQRSLHALLERVWLLKVLDRFDEALAISEQSVRRWVAQADADDGVRGGLTSSEQSELVVLRREKRRLEMENEILRRAAAFFAKARSQNDVPAGPGVGC